MTTLVLATGNPGKAREVRALLPEVTVQTLADHPSIEMPPEVAETFEGNAVAKAAHVAEVLGVPVLADDSGLEVDALDGAPGVRSARYAEGTDEDRYVKLLGAMAEVPDAARTARFRCAMAFVVPGGETTIEQGACEGRIGRRARGDGGFGYDPVFVVGSEDLEAGRTMAELSSDEKNAISHRGRALAAIRPALARHFEG